MDRKGLIADLKNAIGKAIALSLFLSVLSSSSFAQYKIHHDNDFLTTLTYRPNKENGFRLCVSLVAMFTAGVADSNGFRLGGGVSTSYTIDNWTFSTGLDAYKAKEKFGLGTAYAGVDFDDGEYGGTYYLNRYFQGDKQTSGIVSAHLGDFLIRFEDDILAYPFAGFKVYDRYRTAALEARYKGFVIGTNVYTTDINGLTDASLDNRRGVYHKARQISSPIYAGYTMNNMIVRYGWNSKVGGFVGQNSWHRLFFNTPDYKYGDHSNQFLQIGVDQPYTLY